MNTSGACVLLPARHGLGDVLSGYFILRSGREALAKTAAGLAGGIIRSAMVVYEHHYSPSVGDLFRSLHMNLHVFATCELPEVTELDADNRMPPAVRWHQNVFTNPPAAFSSIEVDSFVECPVSKPASEVPSDFVLFSDAAGSPDRVLTDSSITSFVRGVLGLPIVKVGSRGHGVPADIDLCGRTTIAQTLYLAKHARLIVAPLTMFRTCSSLFGTPVIELAEHASPQTIARTEIEYEEGQYGITAARNRWSRWPAHRNVVEQSLIEFAGVSGVSHER